MRSSLNVKLKGAVSSESDFGVFYSYQRAIERGGLHRICQQLLVEWGWSPLAATSYGPSSSDYSNSKFILLRVLTDPTYESAGLLEFFEDEI